MNIHARTMFGLIFAAALALAGARNADAQYVVASPVTTPVVVPTSPALIDVWYPGKLLDRWAANRLAYRSAATTAYQPVTTAVPVTSYRPATGYAYQTTYMPVRTYRPLVATTVYSPVVATGSACCDPCSTPTVSSYGAAPSSACCGTSVTEPYYGNATPVPAIPPEATVPDTVRRPVGGASGENNGAAGGGDDTNSVVTEGDDPEAGNGSDADASPTGWEAPPLRDYRLEGTPADTSIPDKVARKAGSPSPRVTEAVYRESVRPRLATSAQPQKKIPSRAERDAMWTAVVD